MVLLIEQTGTSWNSHPRTTKTDSQLCDDSKADGLVQVIMVMLGGLMNFPFFDISMHFPAKTTNYCKWPFLATQKKKKKKQKAR